MSIILKPKKHETIYQILNECIKLAQKKSKTRSNWLGKVIHWELFRQSAGVGAREYTDCFSAEGVTSHNECPRYDTEQCDGEALGNAEYPFIAIALRSTLTGVVAPDRVLSVGQIELNCVLMLN